MGKTKTTEEFIRDAKNVHGDKYDYSSVTYVQALSNVTIICSLHGKFNQRPNNHLRGVGCPMCVGLYKTTEEFITEAKIIHGNKYEYTSVDYISTAHKINIICKKHGLFSQSANSHLNGNGCPKCAGTQKKTSEEFTMEANSLHQYKYNYSKVNYTNARTKVSIVCPSHGDFEQTPDSHLRGAGCPKCAENTVKTTSEFIVDANINHNNKYDYSKTIYISAKTKVTITCAYHGDFSQTPDTHLKKSGCPSCAKSGFDPSKESTFYIYTFEDYAGFGITNDFKTRSSTHSRTFKKKGIDATLVATYNMSGESALELERHLKRTITIFDTGIVGFRTEATDLQNLPILLNTLKRWQQMQEENLK